MSQPTDHTIAEALQHIAEAFESAPPAEFVSISFKVQIAGYGNYTEQERHGQLDALARLLFGQPGAPVEMSSGGWQYRAERHLGPVEVALYTSCERPADERDAELARLRAENEALRAGVDVSPVAAAAEVPADLAPQQWTALTNPTGGATVPVPMGAPTLDPDMPLSALPDDYGDDHNPADCPQRCEDCADTSAGAR